MRGNMIFGKPSVSRLHCRKCGEETLHKWGRCWHCKTIHAEPKPANIAGGWRHRHLRTVV